MTSLTGTSLKVAIDPAIFTRYPEATIAFALVDVNVFPAKAAGKTQEAYLSDLKQRTVAKLVEEGIDKDNYLTLPVCRSWMSVFGEMEAAEGKRSTIINLLDRACREAEKVKAGNKADLGKISNFVDLYNCVSIQEKTPMGAINLAAVKGDITLRFGHEGETFTGLGRDAVTEAVRKKHVVYADDESILTHLWNYKDAAHACVPREGHQYVLLFADQTEAGSGDAEGAILRAMAELVNIGARTILMEKLTIARPYATFDISLIEAEGVVSYK
jgi:DNA/RNA-binding domain of Phe-tRNA-synthetase-like protein